MVLVATAPYLARCGTPQVVQDLGEAHGCPVRALARGAGVGRFAMARRTVQHLPQGPFRSGDAEQIRAAVLADRASRRRRRGCLPRSWPAAPWWRCCRTPRRRRSPSMRSTRPAACTGQGAGADRPSRRRARAATVAGLSASGHCRGARPVADRQHQDQRAGGHRGTGQRHGRVAQVVADDRAPSAAPTALPRLKAPMFIAEARLGASCAASITRICSGGTIAKLAKPHTRMAMAAATGHCMTAANATSTAASRPRPTTSVRCGARSAARPPQTFPIVMPMPYRTSIAVTNTVDACVRSRRIGEM